MDGLKKFIKFIKNFGKRRYLRTRMDPPLISTYTQLNYLCQPHLQVADNENHGKSDNRSVPGGKREERFAVFFVDTLVRSYIAARFCRVPTIVHQIIYLSDKNKRFRGRKWSVVTWLYAFLSAFSLGTGL